MDSKANTTVLRGLFARWQGGDPDAKAELLRGARSRLEHLSRKLLGNFPEVRTREETDILLSKALDRLEKALVSVNPSSLAHFFRLVANQIRWELLEMKRALRGRHGQKPRVVNFSDKELPDIPVSAPASKKGDLRNEIHEAYESLPELEKEVIDFLFYQNCTQAETAELLGVSVTTVQNRYYAAKLRLRMMVEEERSGEFDDE